GLSLGKAGERGRLPPRRYRNEADDRREPGDPGMCASHFKCSPYLCVSVCPWLFDESACTQPIRQQARPFRERRILLREPGSMRPVLEDVNLSRHAGLAQRG